MNDVKKFVSQWSGRGYERGESQPFWLSFLRDVLGVSEPEKFIRFEVWIYNRPIRKHKDMLQFYW